MKQKLITLNMFLGLFAGFTLMSQCCWAAPTSNRTLVKAPIKTASVPITYQNDKRGRKEFPMTWSVNNQKLFVFDPKIPAWAAYNAQGDRIMTGGASGGKSYCEDIDAPCQTVTGSYKVYSKQGAQCASGEYPLETDDSPAGGALMPYCMYFYKGYAIHGANSVPNHNASHGCIRVLPDAAQWLNENFVEIGTNVLVLPYAK